MTSSYGLFLSFEELLQLKYHRGIMKYVVSVSKTYIRRGNQDTNQRQRSFGLSIIMMKAILEQKR